MDARVVTTTNSKVDSYAGSRVSFPKATWFSCAPAQQQLPQLVSSLASTCTSMRSMTSTAGISSTRAESGGSRFPPNTRSQLVSSVRIRRDAHAHSAPSLSTLHCDSSIRRRPPGKRSPCQPSHLRIRRSTESPTTSLPSWLKLLTLYRCLQDRQAFGEAASEDELIAHFVVPFLRALGWPPERIAVQWRHIDVAVFMALPRIPGTAIW